MYGGEKSFMTNGNFFFDTETCGFHGPIVLIQYCKEKTIELHHVFREDPQKTLDLIEEMCQSNVIAFNLTFDWFHINHTYNTLKLLKSGFSFDEYIEAEYEARDGLCLKPQGCLDLMLYAFKGPLQCTMDRKPIKIRKIPNQIAWKLQEHLDEYIEFDDIFFAGKKNNDRWVVQDIEDEPDFKDIVLNFVPLRNLKILTEYAIGRKRQGYTELKLPQPNELGYAPFAKIIMSLKVWPEKKKPPNPLAGKYNGAWPSVIQWHIERYAFNRKAQEYATMDVQDLLDLYEHFDYPERNDDDSVLAAMVGATRLKGFAINAPKMKKLIKETPLDTIPLDGQASRDYLYDGMNDMDRIVCDGSTEKKMLKIIVGWETSDSKRAQKLIDNRSLRDQHRTYKKMILAGRLHASFKVMVKSYRMAGADGINVQGINKKKEVRRCFTLAFEGEELIGGDFDAFEVTIFLAQCGEGKLMDEINKGKKIHGLFGVYLFPGKTYDEILATDGAGGLDDLYSRSKQGVFLKIYGGNAWTIAQKLFVSEEIAQAADEAFEREYPEIAKVQNKVMQRFTAIKQPGGIGTKIFWTQPERYIETMLGFKRYFDLEIKTMKKLFELAQNPPKDWETKVKVKRRDKLQTVSGATQSALYAAAFGIQGHMQRVATNHPVQGTGAGILKRTQCKLWELQPIGIHKWLIRMMNIHDELIIVCYPGISKYVYEVIDKTIAELKSIVPLLNLTMRKGDNWADTH